MPEPHNREILAERIHQASVKLLASPGICLQHDKIVQMLLARGARKGDRADTLRLPGEMVQEALDSCPPVVRLTEYAEMFEGAEARSLKFAEHYRRVAAEMNCAFLDAGSVIVSSEMDGIHFEAGEHAKLGRAVAAKVVELIGKSTS